MQKHEFERELTENILPFWMKNAVDQKNGGFYGGMTNDHVVLNAIPRTAVSCTRFLWTFSRAYRMDHKDSYLDLAKQAYTYLTDKFWDPKYGGLFWSLDAAGTPVNTRKHHYAQAFGIYGLSEYYRTVHDEDSLAVAVQLFELLEKHAYEPRYGGYIEGCSRDWTELDDKRLGDTDLDCQKSMNTMLHIMEAYSNLAVAWGEERVREQLSRILTIFAEHIISAEGHFRLFFDDQWRSLSDHISYGHDIEGSWLLYEAAEILGDAAALELARMQSLKLAQGVIASGVNGDGSIVQEASPEGIINQKKEWWSQAEAVVGFYNAYQLTGENRYRDAAGSAWNFIQHNLVDKKNSGWFKRLLPDGTADPTSLKIGPWEGSYHESRLCFEMMKRLPE